MIVPLESMQKKYEVIFHCMISGWTMYTRGQLKKKKLGYIQWVFFRYSSSFEKSTYMILVWEMFSEVLMQKLHSYFKPSPCMFSVPKKKIIYLL